MSIPRRRRRSIRTVIADLQSAIADLDARVDALEEEDEWLLDEPVPSLGNIGIGTNADGNIGVGSSAPTVTIPAETFVNLIKAAPINTSMSEGNVGIGSSAPAGNVGIGTGSQPTATEPGQVVELNAGNVGIGSTGTDGNVGVGSSADGNVGVGT